MEFRGVISTELLNHRGRFLGFIRIALAIGFAILALGMLLGLIYEHLSEAGDRAEFHRIGRAVDVGDGHRMNLFCSGSGAPTVVLESGHSVPGLGWSVIQPRVAQFTRACWYDRAGYGWSDPGTFPQRSDEVADELHSLLKESGELAPYLLVGHQFGSFNVRAYEQRYPREVAGLVLIDPVSEVPGNPTMPPKQHIEAMRPGMLRLAQTLADFGVFRLMTKNFHPTPPSGFSDGTWHEIWELSLQPKTIVARMSETPLWASAEQMRRSTSTSTVPLIVLSPAAASPEKRQVQAGLARLSSHGEVELLSPVDSPMSYENSDDMVPYESPGEVAQAIRQMISETRQH